MGKLQQERPSTAPVGNERVAMAAALVAEKLSCKVTPPRAFVIALLRRLQNACRVHISQWSFVTCSIIVLWVSCFFLKGVVGDIET